MRFVALGASLSNTVMLFDVNGNSGQFDLLSFFGFESWIVLQLSSTARTVGQSKLPEGIDLILSEGRPLMSLVS